MNIEKSIQESVNKYLSSEAIENKVSDYMDKAVESAFKDLFTGYKAPVEQIISEKLKEQMIPAIERYDFSKYLVKLDAILVQILESTTVENRTILENFKEFASFENPKKIKVSEIFDEWLKQVAKNIDTDKLEADYESSELRYESPNCYLEIVEEDDSYSWSRFEYAKMIFTCEEDNSLNVMYRLSRWNDGPWELEHRDFRNIETLKDLNPFEIFLINLSSYKTKIEIDQDCIEDDQVEVEEKPEMYIQ